MKSAPAAQIFSNAASAAKSNRGINDVKDSGEFSHALNRTMKSEKSERNAPSNKPEAKPAQNKSQSKQTEKSKPNDKNDKQVSSQNDEKPAETAAPEGKQIDKPADQAPTAQNAATDAGDDQLTAAQLSAAAAALLVQQNAADAAAPALPTDGDAVVNPVDHLVTAHLKIASQSALADLAPEDLNDLKALVAPAAQQDANAEVDANQVLADLLNSIAEQFPEERQNIDQGIASLQKQAADAAKPNVQFQGLSDLVKPEQATAEIAKPATADQHKNADAHLGDDAKESLTASLLGNAAPKSDAQPGTAIPNASGLPDKSDLGKSDKSTITALATATTANAGDAATSATTTQQGAQPQFRIGAQSVTPASQAPQAEAGNPVERAVANQVARGVQHAANTGARVLTIRLTPPELGTVRVDVFEHAGAITARLHAEDDGVRNALERFLPQIRQDLRSHDAPIRDVLLASAFNQNADNPNRGLFNGRQQRRTPSDGPVFAIDGIRETQVTGAPKELGGTVDADGVNALA